MTNYALILPKTELLQNCDNLQKQRLRLPHSKRKKRIYKCKECQKNFSNHTTLKSHELECLKAIATPATYCNACQAIYSNEESFQKHNAALHANEKFVCLCCSKEFVTRGHLSKHALQLHGYATLQYYCMCCRQNDDTPFRFANKLDLMQHYQQQHIVATLPLVSKDFTNFEEDNGDDDNDDDDVEMQDLEWLDDCIDDVDNLSFSTSWDALDFDLTKVLNSYATESNSEAGEQQTTATSSSPPPLPPCAPFRCAYCEYECYKSTALLKHFTDAHNLTTNQTLVCVYCQRQFTKLLNYKRHLERMHTLLPRHRCFFCERQFTSMDHLKKHVLSVHQNERRFFCTICKAGFMQSGHLKQHLETHTRLKRYKCAECGRTYWKRVDLQRHKCVAAAAGMSLE